MTLHEGNAPGGDTGRPAISVIIVNYNTQGLLQACLRTVFREAAEVPLEVLVIDNGSADGSVQMVRAEFPRVRLTVNAANRGFAGPNNDGIRGSRGEYVLLLNSDTEVRPGALRILKRFLDEHPEAAACGPMLLNSDGSVQHSVRGFPTLWTHACDMLFLDRLFPRTRFFGRGAMAYFPYDRTAAVDHVMAAAFLVRGDVLSTVGLLDERFVLYHNDMDWCYRMVQDGWRIYYVHDSQVVHHGGKTMDLVNRDLAYLDEQWNNTMLFYQKHYGRASVAAFKIILAIGFVPRALGWWLIRAARPTPRSLLMSAFSMKTLRIGLAFWQPLPYT